MNPENDAIDRLFRAARAQGLEPVTMPRSLENRILAARRQLGAQRLDEVASVVSLFRRGLIAASLVAVVTALVCHHLDSLRTPAMDSAVLDSVASLSFLP